MCRGQGSGPRISGLGGQLASACSGNMLSDSGAGCSLLRPLNCRNQCCPHFLKRMSGRVAELVTAYYKIDCLALCSLGCIPLPCFWCGQKRKDNLYMLGVSCVRTESHLHSHTTKSWNLSVKPSSGYLSPQWRLGSHAPWAALQPYRFIADQPVDKLPVFYLFSSSL